MSDLVCIVGIMTVLVGGIMMLLVFIITYLDQIVEGLKKRGGSQ